MQHPFQTLAPEYAALLATVEVTRAGAVAIAAHAVLTAIEHYRAASHATGVPAALIGALDYRESDCNPRTGLGQGDPWDRASIHVPRGCGPFVSWESAAEFYIHYDHLDDNSAPWTMPYCCWKGEAWNGFGPRNHGIHTGYLWGATNYYSKGKYVSDGVWDADHVDGQVGIVPILLKLAELDHSLVIASTAAVVPASFLGRLPQPPPAGVGGVDRTGWLQGALNKVLHLDPPLVIDDNYGRRTREAVRAFQRGNGLIPDGLAGPLTLKGVDRALAMPGVA